MIPLAAWAVTVHPLDSQRKSDNIGEYDNDIYRDIKD
jgi:hypothetical protein